MSETSRPCHDRTLFIIEDDSEVRNSLCALIVALGRDLVVEAFSSATEFIDYINLREISGSACLIIDEKMPGCSGTELVEKLISQGRRFPFVMTSGHGDQTLRQRAEKLGAVAFIEKPFPSSQLIDEIDRVFGF